MSKRSMPLAPGLVSLLFLALLTLAPSASANATPITYNFIATSASPNVSDFTLSYTDNDMDNMFDLTELVPNSFSGVTVEGDFFDDLAAIPVHSVDSPLTDGDYIAVIGPAWKFHTMVPC